MKPSKDGIDVNLCVADIERSLAFYVELLGLELVESYPSGPGTTHRLRFGDSFVKLTDPTAPPSSTVQEPGLVGGFGLRAITFQIDDFLETWEAVSAAGAPVVMAHTSHPKAGVHVGMVLDPDGNVVELLRRGEPWDG